MLSMGPWRGRVLLMGLVLTLYLITAVIISGIQDPSTFSSRILRNGQAFGVNDGAVKPGDENNLSIRKSKERSAKLQWCSTLKYQNPPGPLTALVSFPGSGNTWMRYLIQQVTGLYTGSVYTDLGLLKNGFPGETTRNGSVIVIKTHEWGENARKMFKRAVLIIRDPAAAIQAEFNRQGGGHVGFAPPKLFKQTNGQHWRHFVSTKLAVWRDMNLDWVFHFPGPLHVIFFELLEKDVAGTMKGLVRFLNLTENQANLDCAVERREGIYRRPKRILNFDLFTKEMKTVLNNQRELVSHAIRSSASISSNANVKSN